jgi:8-oxo-dGTP diphosphatase
MIYVARQWVADTAHAADEDEVADVAWCDQASLNDNVPRSLFGPVQEYLNAALGNG